MTDKEKLDAIRAEIHRLVKVRGYDKEMANDLFTFMDSLPDEPVSEDLGDYINKLSKQFPEVSFAKLSRIAVRVANWQKEQMMEKAVNTEVCHIFGDEDKAFFPMYGMDMKQGDKVKLIIIKEE